MKAAAREFGEYNIRVNAVNPGKIAKGKQVPGSGGRYVDETMPGRLSTAKEFADFVVFMSGKSNISGQLFNLDSRAF